ncbi:MAG: mechanosensitive ion channel family protein [Candidatus Cloacimonetes bacterium]|nr:mechanosensitive ion channel family protein [Candidatus Cloacimonadota bacterium]
MEATLTLVKELIDSLYNSPVAFKIVHTLIWLLILWLINLITVKLINKKISGLKTQYHWRKLINVITIMIAIVILIRIWFQGTQSLITYLGLLSAGIAIALKDVLANLVGWLYIITRRPFKVGDRIQIGEHSGDVIDQSFFEFTLLEINNWVQADQSTGRLIHIPNGKVFYQELANYDEGFKYLWNEISVVITFESDWQKAKKILLEVVNDKGEHLSKTVENQVKRAARKYMIYYKNLTPIVYTSVVENGVKLTIRHLCETRKRRGYTEAIWEDVLVRFSKQKDITLAYPTTRFYKNSAE